MPRSTLRLRFGRFRPDAWLASATLLSLAVAARGADAPPKPRVAQESLDSLKQNYSYETKPAPPPAEAKPAAATKDTVVMSTVTVTARKTPKLSENEVLTDKGLSEMFLKRYPGQSVKGQSATTKDVVQVPNYAAMSHRDDVRQSQKKDLDDLADTLEQTGDAAAAKKLKQEIDDTFLRRRTDQEKAMEKSANGGR